MSDVLDFPTLQRLTGYLKRGAVERWLEGEGIRFFRGRKGPWTTRELVNAAGGIQVPPASQQEPALYGADEA